MAGLLGFYLGFLLVAMVWPTVRVWRQTGINPLVLARGDDLEGFVGRWFKLLIGALGLYLALGAAGIVAQIGPIRLPASPVFRASGIVLLGLSLVWVVAAQWRMGHSWRVGIDHAHSTKLVVGGPFEVSRNPIFLGMMAQLVGLFLVVPDAITLTVALVGFVLISVQIRQEEAHLAAQHGPDYAAYRQRVRRWL